jgi:hypothetical protein
MQTRRAGHPERSHEESFSMIAGAGFTGVCLDPSAAEIPATRKLKPLFEEHRLKCMMNVFPNEPGELRPLLELAQELDACLVNIIGGVTPVDVGDATPLVKAWLSDASDFDMPVLFETHRDSLLNDLFYTLQLIERVPEMRLCADLSHFVVDRELRLPLRPSDRRYFETILDRSDCFQGRIATREQIQVPIAFPQHAAWVDLFRDWWKYGMRRWRERSGADAELIFLCELGPPGYAITDAEENELSDRWLEAAVIRKWAEDIWQELEKADGGRSP